MYLHFFNQILHIVFNCIFGVSRHIYYLRKVYLCQYHNLLISVLQIIIMSFLKHKYNITLIYLPYTLLEESLSNLVYLI